MEVGLEIEAQTLSRPLQQDGVHRQHHHQGQQAEHHHLIHPFHAVAQSLDTHQHADTHHNSHIGGHRARLAQQIAEFPGNSLGVQPLEAAPQYLHKIIQQPPGDHSIKHHQQIVAREAHIAVPMPVGAGGLQPLEGQGDAPLAGPAHGQLHHHDGQTQNDQKQQIQQHKSRSAIFPCDIGKAPHVAQADGAARRDEHKAQAGGKRLSFLHWQSKTPLL